MGVLRIIICLLLFSISAFSIEVNNQPLPSGAGTGDMFGPATNTDEYVPQWDGADSKTLKDGFPISSQGKTWVNLSTTANMRSNIGLTNHQLITVTSSGNIQTTGAMYHPITTVTGNVTVNNNHDLLLCDATSATVNITLPAVSGKSGLTYRFKKIAGSYPVIIDPNASEQIDGATTFIISALYSSVSIRTNGTAWCGF